VTHERLSAQVTIRFGAACARDTGTERVRAFEPERRCAHEGCHTVLSIYNPSSYCGVHDRGRTSRPPRQNDRKLLERTCANGSCLTSFVTANPARVYCSDRCRMRAFQQRRQNGRRAARA